MNSNGEKSRFYAFKVSLSVGPFQVVAIILRAVYSSFCTKSQ